MSGSQAARRELAEHGYAAPSPQPAKPSHASQSAGATSSTWVPPLVLVCVGPPAKRPRTETMSSQFAPTDVAIGDSFHSPHSAVYYTPPNARSLASADATLGPLESQVSVSNQGQTGTGNSQVPCSRGQIRRAFRDALLVERYTINEHVSNLVEIRLGLRESRSASLRELIAENHGLKLRHGVDVPYRPMFEERIAVDT